MRGVQVPPMTLPRFVLAALALYALSYSQDPHPYQQWGYPSGPMDCPTITQLDGNGGRIVMVACLTQDDIADAVSTIMKPKDALGEQPMKELTVILTTRRVSVRQQPHLLFPQ